VPILVHTVQAVAAVTAVVVEAEQSGSGTLVAATAVAAVVAS
jgi:hypothetical protein